MNFETLDTKDNRGPHKHYECRVQERFNWQQKIKKTDESALTTFAKDCWCKETSKGGAVPNNKGKKGKGRNSVNEVTTPTESTTTPPVGTSTSQISRITQDTDTWDRPVSMDEDEDESCETGYILAPIRHRETFHQSKDWYVVHDSERTIKCKSSTLHNVHFRSSPSQQSKP